MLKLKRDEKMASKKHGNTAVILGVPVFSTTESEVLSVVADWIDGRAESGGVLKGVNSKKRLIFTPNSEILVSAAENEEFREILKRADINIPDGMGVVLASRVLKTFGSRKVNQTISTRVTGIDMVEAMVKMAASKGYQVYFLGGEGDEAALAAKKMVAKYASVGKLKIAFDSGPKRIMVATTKENKEVVDRINRFRPDILFVAFGHGRQEKWLVEHLDELHIKVGMGVGGAFNYLSGKSKRPPKWVGAIGFEWLWRLILEPWRWKRQLKLVKFWWLVLKSIY